jgi:hypothetical protein
MQDLVGTSVKWLLVAVGVSAAILVVSWLLDMSYVLTD